MKKDVVGHMMAPKETVKKRILRLDILPRLLCLLLAILFWLLLVNFKDSTKTDANVELPLTQTVAITKA